MIGYLFIFYNSLILDSYYFILINLLDTKIKKLKCTHGTKLTYNWNLIIFSLSFDYIYIYWINLKINTLINQIIRKIYVIRCMLKFLLKFNTTTYELW